MTSLAFVTRRCDLLLVSWCNLLRSGIDVWKSRLGQLSITGKLPTVFIASFSILYLYVRNFLRTMIRDMARQLMSL